MCIKYRYHAICFNPGCDNVLGRKVRSSFCPEARKFHRLGCCAAGVVIETTRVRERFLHCDECKQEQRASSRQPNVASAAAMAPGTRSRGQGARPNAGAAKKEKRDGTDLFDFVFANPVAEVNAGAGAKKEEEAEATGKGKGKKKATAQVIDKEEEADKEDFVVRSPETAPRGRGRGRGRARGRARGSGRGRGRGRGASRASAQTPASAATTPQAVQAAQGATEAREDAAEERLPYGFAAEGERQQRIAEQLYLYTWDLSDEE
ncbi:hypothetical protein F5Y13DRAFT_197753 [Hypoxylon sp. FL1857]|nr:hypothetical protein F5Y13DRAFT_197753 [Hypoxylon sp. FL1857]